MSERGAAGSAREVWGASPAGTAFADGLTPGSPDFFDAVLSIRSTREMPWLTRLIPFREMADRDVLEVGCGAGYDAYEFLRHGARYVGVDITPENIDRTRSHLQSKGLVATGLRVADAMHLPYANQSFDVVFSNGVLHHVEDTAGSLREALRVLRPGGDLWITLYHRDSAFHWLTLYLYLWILRGRRRSYASFDEYLSTIELTTANERPVVRVFSRSQVDRMLSDTGFDRRRICVRKLLREDLPSPRVLHGLPWRAIPESVLDVFATRFGWYVVAHARRPLK